MARVGESGSGGASSSGAVTGIPPTTIDGIARWNDTTGTTIKNSPGTLVQDSGAIEAQAIIVDRQVAGTIDVPTNYTMISDAIEMQPGGIITMNPGSKIIIL
jgi:hypothetical protein